MQLKIKFYHLLLFGAIATSSCKKDYVRQAPIIPPPPNVSFANDIYPTLSSGTGSCILSGCHDGTTLLNLSSQSVAYNSLITGIASTSNAPHAGKPFIDTTNAASSVFYVRLTDPAAGPAGIMPTSGALSSSYTAKVLSWIQDGAKNN